MEEDAKIQLINHYRKTRMVRDLTVLDVFSRVPREEFLPEQIRHMAYLDQPLSIGYGATISAPHMTVYFLDYLHLKPGMRVLEVGGGSGYQAALLAEAVSPGGEVITLEIVEELVQFAQQNLEKTGYNDRVKVIHGDGTLGYPDGAPYDRVCVTAAGPQIPPPLIRQMKIGGILCIPVGKGSWAQSLLRITKNNEQNEFSTENLGGVAFVPLRGKYGI